MIYAQTKIRHHNSLEFCDPNGSTNSGQTTKLDMCLFSTLAPVAVMSWI